MFTLAAIAAMSVSTLSTLAYFGAISIDEKFELPMNLGKVDLTFTEETPLKISIER